MIFTLAAMKELEVVAADIGNAFLYRRTKEKIYIKLDLNSVRTLESA